MSSIKRKILRMLYPFILKVGKSGKNATILKNSNNVSPSVQIDFSLLLFSNLKALEQHKLAGKKVMIVNTASDCGYTGQYAELQTIYDNFEEELMIIAVPANDFGKQEQGNDESISQFCKVNYGVTFLVAKKSVVIKGEDQHPIYQWLSNANLNGWNNHAPDWNFGKYLINENGILTHYFGPSISPLDDVVIDAIRS